MLVRPLETPWMKIAICLASLLTPAYVFAQSSGNPLSDIEQQVLQGLSPEQRDSIMNQLGLGSGTTSSDQSNGRTQRDQNAQDQGAQRPITADQQAEMDRLSPYLAGDDWVIVTVDSRPLPALPGGGGGGGGGVAAAAQQAAAGGIPPSALAALRANPALAGAAGAAAAGGASSTLGGATAGTGTSTGPISATAGGYAAAGTMNPGDQQQNTDPNSPGNPPELTDDEKKQRQDLIDLIRSKNPYQLSHDGVLSLPGFSPIPLAGLTEQLATLRIGSEAALRQLYIRITKLPLKKTGAVALRPFGYDLFDRPVSSFAPVTDVPVPSSYTVGPGDQLEVQLFGSQNRILYLLVGRDGRVQFPNIGPISVAGQSFDEARATIEGRVERQMIGTHASVTMGDTRSIRVFVMGEAKNPGSYTVSGLAAISSALFAAGGIRGVGSLRNIQLKRQGAIVRQFDLYDMLIRGDNTDDVKLLSGDVIFIPPIGPTVSVDGQVRRPAIYEMRGETTVEGVVRLAGGLTPEADHRQAALTRIDANQHRIVVQVDIAGAAPSQIVRDGDFIRIPRLRPTIDAGVRLEGYLFSTGDFAWHEGMRLSDVIRSVDDLKPNADQHYVLIRRELPPDRRIVSLSADLDAALNARGTAADVILMPRDRITVFDLQSSRDRVIEPLLLDLRLQSSSARPTEAVQVDGHVNVPGTYPLEQNMTVRDLVRAGGGLSDAAYGGKAELTRYTIVNGESRRAELLQIDLTAALRGDPTANIQLRAFDNLSVKEVQAWEDLQQITLLGEVKFPGVYSIRRGETLRSVVQRAGGLTDLAFAEGSVFTRKELRVREQQQLDTFAIRMQSDVAFMALQAANTNSAAAATAATGALAAGQSLLAQLKSTRAVGRLVISLKAALDHPAGSIYDVMLRGGDQLIVPKFEQEVSVIGEVQNPTSHLYRPGWGRDEYIALSGGETRRADSGRVYVVRADGSVTTSSDRWFSRSPPVKAGDTVVVPLNAEHLPTLPMWQAVTQILYNIAIAVLAVHNI
jgi:polysaccharide export outer membrane protein